MRSVQAVLLAGLMAGLGLGSAGAAHGQARVPATVMTHLQGLEARCKAAGGQAGGGRFIVVQDFTGDRRPDYLISEGDFICTGRPNLFRQNGEARVDIFVTNAAGQALRTFSDRLVGFRVVAGSPVKVQIARRGAVCGPAAGPTTQCATQLAWNGQSFGAGVSVSDADRTGQVATTPPAATTQVAAATAAQVATPPGETEAAFLARCRGELVARDAGAARWADDECGDRWKAILAAAPAADALLAATPTPGQRPTLAELRTRMTGVRWSPQAPRGQLAAGRLGGLGITIEGVAAPTAVGAAWNAVGQPIPYDIVGAMSARGARMVEMSCAKIGVGEGERIYAGTLPGRSPFTASVSQRTAPTGNAQSFYSVTVSLDGRHPPRGSKAGCDF